jgi:hypothetical protein
MTGGARARPASNPSRYHFDQGSTISLPLIVVLRGGAATVAAPDDGGEGEGDRNASDVPEGRGATVSRDTFVAEAGGRGAGVTGSSAPLGDGAGAGSTS